MRNYYRYMSMEEFSKMSCGADVIQCKGHFTARTSSQGICFLSEIVEDDRGRKYSPEWSYRFLSGIVSEDVLVKFESDTELTESYGIYADPYGTWGDYIAINEYCCKGYNRETMRPVAYCIGNGPLEFDTFVGAPWYEFH